MDFSYYAPRVFTTFQYMSSQILFVFFWGGGGNPRKKGVSGLFSVVKALKTVNFYKFIKKPSNFWKKGPQNFFACPGRFYESPRSNKGTYKCSKKIRRIALWSPWRTLFVLYRSTMVWFRKIDQKLFHRSFTANHMDDTTLWTKGGGKRQHLAYIPPPNTIGKSRFLR